MVDFHTLLFIVFLFVFLCVFFFLSFYIFIGMTLQIIVAHICKIWTMKEKCYNFTSSSRSIEQSYWMQSHYYLNEQHQSKGRVRREDLCYYYSYWFSPVFFWWIKKKGEYGCLKIKVLKITTLLNGVLLLDRIQPWFQIFCGGIHSPSAL